MNPPHTAGQNLLLVERLRVWFPIRRGIFSRVSGHVRAVDGVSLAVAPGETLALVGESGCGKTTLGRALIGLDPVYSGKILFEDRDLAAMRGAELRRLRTRLQTIFQDPMASLNPRMTIGDIVTEGPLAHGMLNSAEAPAAARRLLEEVGVDSGAIDRYPHEFSGGQRQRICIARALSMRPRLIVCDEAVSSLDVSVQAQVLNLLMDLRERHGQAYLFISHDLSVVRHIARRVAVMYLGRLMECGPAAAVFNRPGHPYTRMLLAAAPVPLRPPRRRSIPAGDVPSPAAPPPGCRFHPRCPYAVADCRRSAPDLESPAGAGPEHRVACLRRDELPDPDADGAALEVRS